MIGGSIDVQSDHLIAYGVTVDTHGVAGIEVGGNVYVDSSYAKAVGLSAIGFAGASVTVGGNVYATGSNGKASGVVVEVKPGGSGNVSVGGNVTADGYYGASGVSLTAGTGNVSIGGNAIALAAGGAAIAVYGNSTSYMGVHIGGNVYALGNTSAAGVRAYGGTGDGNVSVGGNVIVAESYGTAIGVRVTGATGAVPLTVGGNVTTDSTTSYTTAVQAFSGATSTLNVGGSVEAIGRNRGLRLLHQFRQCATSTSPWAATSSLCREPAAPGACGHRARRWTSPSTATSWPIRLRAVSRSGLRL